MSTGGVGGTSSSSSSSNTSNQTSSSADPFGSLKLSDFLQLMITELQNQDPTNPVDDSKIMDEIGQMESIQSTTELNTTLQSMSLGQSLNLAGSMIDKEIMGLDDNGNSVSGVVSGVIMNNGTASLVVGSSTVQMSNVQEVAD